MKKKLTQLMALCSVLLLMFSSCKKDETRVVAAMGNAGTLTASSTAPTLTPSTSSNTAVTFTWAATTITGYQAPITYTMQFAVKGTNFATYQEIAVSLPNQAVTVGDLNKYLLALNLPTGTSSQVEVRVKSVIAANEAPAYSNVVTLTVTPYSLASYLYVPGAYQGWNATTADSLVSATSNGVYTGTISFTSGNREFLILPQRANYNNKYATNEPTTSTSTTVVVNGPNNLVAPATAGKYLITLDVNNKTIAFTSVP